MDLILGSTSIYRQTLLSQLGLPFRVVAPLVDEDTLKDDRPARELAEYLAVAKADSVAALYPQSVVIAGDQVAVHGATILGKPGTVDNAFAQLRRLSGDTHLLITAIAVRAGAETFRHTDITRLTMRPLADEEISRYVTTDQPLDCCGSYKIESRGSSLFSTIETVDHSAIRGLPLKALAEILRGLGFQV